MVKIIAVILAATVLAIPFISTTQTITQEIVAPPSGGAGAPPTPPPSTIETNFFGITADFTISDTGEILEAITATSADENLTLTIPEGAITLDAEGDPLSSLTAAVDPSPPDPPEGVNIIGLAYDFGPPGATFDPAITFEYTYDPADIPEGVAEGDLILAYYDEVAGEWVELPSIVDPVTHTITASISHFTTFAIIAPPVPPAPAAFSVSSLSIQPAEVQPQEAITIAVSVANTGGTEGSYTVVLEINGVKEAEKRMTIAAGSTESISFSLAREDAGNYSVVVDGLSGSFTVVAPELPAEEINWPLVGTIIAGVVVVGLLSFFLVRRKIARS